jgi:hypothetical protein
MSSLNKQLEELAELRNALEGAPAQVLYNLANTIETIANWVTRDLRARAQRPAPQRKLNRCPHCSRPAYLTSPRCDYHLHKGEREEVEKIQVRTANPSSPDPTPRT